jgi:hypothetical protein
MAKELTDKKKAKVVATLQKRQEAGTLGAKDMARLAALGGTPAGTQPVTGGGVQVTPGINDSIDTSTGQINNPDDVLGQNKVFDPNDPYWQQLKGDIYQNTYDLNTRGLEDRKAREMEEARQIAAERGLPFDPDNANSAYSKGLSGVNDRYDTLYANATNSANLAANSAFETQGGLANQGFANYLQGVLGISAADAAAKANEITKYGIDEETKNRIKVANIAAKASKGSGGSSSGSSDSGSSGFDVVL